ncbi:MAG: class I SAM-dependent rRNA methyltransferase [Verrucomicrobiales bacterium]|nr:class I SAM-dependent rRNA methyltransferase [Verrucomicrobiales bacterium]
MSAWQKNLSPPPNSETSAWRIYNDAKAGIWIDNFDGRWLVQTREKEFPKFLKSAVPEMASSVYWKPRDKAAKTEPEWTAGERITDRFSVQENGVSGWIDFAAGYSSGIFLDQRMNRERVADHCQEGDRILNTFAYTGVFSVAAATTSGAITTSLDLSQTYLDWTRENFQLNDVDPETQFFCKGDTFEWLRAFAKRGRTFHGVILDPPTFSRNKKTTFRTDRDYADLAKLAAAVVEPGGWILACANTHRMSARDFCDQIKIGIRRKITSMKSLPMPPEFHGENYLKSVWVDFE